MSKQGVHGCIVAKLSIKKRKDVKETSGLVLRDYDVTIDGKEIDKLTGISLSMGIDEFNQCTLSFFVDDVDVDADFLAALKAHIKKEE